MEPARSAGLKFNKDHIIKNPFLRWGLLIGCYALVVVYRTGWNSVEFLSRGRPISWPGPLFEEIIYWSLWLILTPLILLFAKKYRIEWNRLLSTTTAHLLFFAVVSVCQYFSFMYITFFLFRAPTPEGALLDVLDRLPWLYSGIFRNIYKYWAIVGTYYAIDYSLKYRERERESTELKLRASQLEAQLAQAQLAALKMQLQPHFLFNTLNTISVLMREDVDKANRMLLRLSELLRIALEKMEVHEIPLEQEIAFLKRYLEIEEMRFEDRLHVKIEVQPEVVDALVPNLVLQPLVENAIRHGITKSASAGRIEVKAARGNGKLILEVFDDGPGIKDLESNKFKSNGIGLANTQRRLEQLYGDDFSFELRGVETGGTLVRVVIPLRKQR